MQIVIPMSGFGERFKRAGYQVPKPLIEVEGKTIIAHVVDLFPGEEDFTFIVNREHLENEAYRLAEILAEVAPRGKIISVEPHKKGPVYAVLKAIQHLAMDKPTIVNYCDFSSVWDWTNFKKFVTENQLMGAIPAYRGFHPHSLGSTNYAYVRESGGKVLDIQEKKPFSDNRMNEFASSGTYYFGTGQLMKDAFEWVVQNDVNVQGEFYVSNSYKYLIKEKLSTFVYPLEYFMQWGTPLDLMEYESWSRVFRTLSDSESEEPKANGSLILPLAGLGRRFSDEGYSIAKPLIEVSGLPMVLQAANSLPASQKQVFVIRSDMAGKEQIEAALEHEFSSAQLIEVEGLTDGQARTIAKGSAALEEAESGVVLVGTCDSGVLYNRKLYSEILESEDWDVVVWSYRGHPNAIRRPEMFGWLAEKDGQVLGVSVKSPLERPESDPIVIGTMTFRNKSTLETLLKSLFDRLGTVNGEFYLDS